MFLKSLWYAAFYFKEVESFCWVLGMFWSLACFAKWGEASARPWGFSESPKRSLDEISQTSTLGFGVHSSSGCKSKRSFSDFRSHRWCLGHLGRWRCDNLRRSKQRWWLKLSRRHIYWCTESSCNKRCVFSTKGGWFCDFLGTGIRRRRFSGNESSGCCEASSICNSICCVAFWRWCCVLGKSWNWSERTVRQERQEFWHLWRSGWTPAARTRFWSGGCHCFLSSFCLYQGGWVCLHMGRRFAPESVRWRQPCRGFDWRSFFFCSAEEGSVSFHLGTSRVWWWFQRCKPSAKWSVAFGTTEHFWPWLHCLESKFYSCNLGPQ